MTDYKDIQNNLIFEIENIIKKYNLSVQNFLKTTSPEHKKAHDEIMITLNKNISNEAQKDEIAVVNAKFIENLLLEIFELETKSTDIPEYKAAQILHIYLNNFYGKYYIISDGDIIYFDKLNFKLPTSHSSAFEELDHNAKYIESRMGNINLNPIRELSLLIMPDGTCYNAQNDHLTCARWLNVNGIDIDRSIRFETSKEYYDFNFGSLYNYDFSEKSDKNEILEITDEQALVLADLYKSLCVKWKYLKPLEKCLINCKGFGFSLKDYVPDIGSKNLLKIENETKGFFDSYEYMKYLKQRIKSDPLTQPQR